MAIKEQYEVTCHDGNVFDFGYIIDTELPFPCHSPLKGTWDPWEKKKKTIDFWSEAEKLLGKPGTICSRK